MSKNWFEHDFPLDYAAWRGVVDRADGADDDDEMERAFHVWVMEHWGGCRTRAIAWAVLANGGRAASK